MSYDSSSVFFQAQNVATYQKENRFHFYDNSHWSIGEQVFFNDRPIATNQSQFKVYRWGWSSDDQSVFQSGVKKLDKSPIEKLRLLTSECVFVGSEKSICPWPIENQDLDRLMVLQIFDDRYLLFSDGDRLILNGKTLIGSSAENYEIIAYDYSSDIYIVSNDRLYKNSDLLVVLDNRPIHFFGDGYYLLDSEIFFDGISLGTDVDRASFGSSGVNYGSERIYGDGSQYFLNGRSFLQNEGLLVRHAEKYLLQIGSFFYWGTNRLPTSSAKPVVLQIDQSNYYKVGSQIFFEDKAIPQADSSSFQIISTFRARDKNVCYVREQLESCN